MNESTPISCGYKKGFQKKKILGKKFPVSLEKSGFMVIRILFFLLLGGNFLQFVMNEFTPTSFVDNMSLVILKENIILEKNIWI